MESRSQMLLRPLQQHPLVAFFVLAYTITWLMWVSVMGLWPRLSFADAAGLGSVGPAVAAFVMTHMVVNRASTMKRHVRRTIGIRWYAIALSGPLAATAISAAIVFGAQFLQILTQQPSRFVVFVLVVPLSVLYGPLGEEPGWRGYALPRLQRAYGPLRASLILGALWACWHLPLFLIPEVRSQTHLGWWMLIVMALTVCMTWVYNNTQGSVLVAILLHASMNASLDYFNLVSGYSSHPNYDAALALVLIALAIFLVTATRGKLSFDLEKQPEVGVSRHAMIR